ncbi:MAG: hypothetical protein PF638_08335 [Candidatus Delongbacteria bacterium]|jgi:hypothetical protein|nr:hypothetical protein [Candidatus Delongbacteria bacterium]
MYKKLQIIFSISIALLIMSCAQEPNHTVKEVDGVKYYFNKHEPSQVVNINPVKLFEIDGVNPSMADSIKGFNSITKILTDYNDNVYILDSDKAIIKKYNNKGEFDKLIGKKGNEVNHFSTPTEIVLKYDTLIVYNAKPKKYMRFLTNGTQLQTSQVFMGGISPQYITSDCKTNLACFRFTTYTRDSIRYMDNSICMLNSKFKVEKIIKEIKYSPDSSGFFLPDLFTTYFQKDGNFYVAYNGSDKYSIEVINSRGNLKYVIEKEFEKLPYNSGEMVQINQFITLLGGSLVDSTKTYFKKAVNMIYVDKYERIWTLPSVARTEENEFTHYVDIFKDGVYLDKIILDVVGKDESFLLSGNRLYVTNEVTNKIRVYEY